MTTLQRLLILDRDFPPRLQIPLVSEREGEDLFADSVANISAAIAKLAQHGYDAVLCRVDGPEELSFLIRIRHASPTIPIVALTPRQPSALDELALASGADEVRSRARTFPGDSGVPSTVGLHELIERTRAALVESRRLRAAHQDLRKLTRRTIARTRVALTDRLELAKPWLEGFLPLVVEDDPDQALLLKRAFEKTFLPFPLPILEDAESAVNYLSGSEPFSDRSLHPLPNLLLLDLNLPMKSGLEVLRWVRSRPESARLCVFVLTNFGSQFDRAMFEGADYVYTKPLEFPLLKDQVRAMALRWWMLEKARKA